MTSGIISAAITIGYYTGIIQDELLFFLRSGEPLQKVIALIKNSLL